MITFDVKGFPNTDAYLNRMKKAELFATLEKYGAQGAAALGAATPVETGRTAMSWTYKIIRRSNYFAIIWSNTHVVDGQNIAILLQYGHGTGTGGYVPGRDYINPVILPLLDKMIADFTREVKK